MTDNVIMANSKAREDRSTGANRGPIDPAMPLPNPPDGLSVELLNRLVAERHPGSTVTGVELVEAKAAELDAARAAELEAAE